MSNGYAIGTRVFTDGSTRIVYRNPAGRQYVLDDHGRRVYGSWLPQQATDPDAYPAPQGD